MNAVIDAERNYANSILKAVSIIDPDAIVAGGAPRDWFYGRAANDIDLYYRTFATTQREAKVQLETLGFDVDIAYPIDEDMPEEVPYDNPGILGVFNLQDPVGLPVQFIALKGAEVQARPSDFIQYNFDFGICMVWVSMHSVGIQKSIWFNEDQSSGLLTLFLGNLTEKQRERTPERAAKMQERFPEHKIRIL